MKIWTEAEYLIREKIMRGIVGAIVAGLLAFGCTTITKAGQDPLHQNPDDGVLKPVWAYQDDDVFQRGTDADSIGDSTPSEVSVDAVANAVARVVQRVREACLRDNEFSIRHEGRVESYGCMSLRRVNNDAMLVE